MISDLLGLWRSIPLSQLGIAAALLAILVPLCQFIYNVTLHPLAGYPGPLLHGGSYIPSAISRIRGRPIEKMHELHEKYGPVVRFTPNEITYISAQAWKDIYAHRKGQEQIPPNPSYGVREVSFFGSYGLVWEVNPHEHARRRRLISEGFSDKSLREQEPIIRKYVDLLMQRMRENAGTVINLNAWFNYTTFDIIGDLTFGEPFDCLKNSRLHPWINFLFSQLHMMLYGQITAEMGVLGTLIEALAPQRLKDDVLKHAALTKDKVDRRRMRSTNRPDFMTNILQEASKESLELSLPKLYADSNILVIAGSETSATLLSAAAFNLMRNPHTLHRLQTEIRSAYAFEHDITFETVSKLPYLGAVLNESLRIHPPLPAAIHRQVPTGGTMIDGRFVPEGTTVHVPQWPAFRSKSNFTDPHSFIPERWLPGEMEERFAGDNWDVFQPFSTGARNCIGRSLAYMETRLVLSKLIWNFDMELMEDSVTWDDMRVFVLWQKGPMNVVLTPVER